MKRIQREYKCLYGELAGNGLDIFERRAFRYLCAKSRKSGNLSEADIRYVSRDQNCIWDTTCDRPLNKPQDGKEDRVMNIIDDNSRGRVKRPSLLLPSGH